MRASLLMLAAGVMSACSPPAQTLDIATTTSVHNSGLLSALLPHFTAAQVRVHAAGSGRALQMLADGTVALVISHAPDAEARYLASHPQWRYRKLAFNHFIVVGPADDPASIKLASSVVDAFRKIAAGGTFVSRGDQSGTHEREEALWREALVRPPGDRYITSGRGMALALRHADERRAYTLSDEATFWQMQRSVSVITLRAGDPQLLNTYAVLHRDDDRTAQHFADWLGQGQGRQLLMECRIENRVAFTPWPDGCDDVKPTDLPCVTAPASGR